MRLQKTALVLIACATLLSLYWSWSTHQRMRRVEEELVRRQQDEGNHVAQTHLLAKQADELSRETAARAAVQEARISELAAQRTQLDDLLQSLSMSRDENLLSAIDASLHVAQQQDALTGSVEPLLAALQSAQERVARAKSLRLEPLHRALSRDMDRIKATPVADVGALAAKLDEATRMVDELPLLSEPRVGRRAPAAGGTATASAPAPTLQGAAPAGWWHQTGSDVRDSAHQWARVLGEQLLSLVRLTRIDHPDSALIAPDQALMLRTNLKLRLLNARLALLSRQFYLARGDVAAIDTLIARYFDLASARGRAMHALLVDVGAQLVHTDLPRPDDSLAALNALLVVH